ncbi:hypothetical protein JXQ31_04950 [candidate division KSB1 bacterium]|nr:hypothetical protein [candidate division KSB1 bacterium]
MKKNKLSLWLPLIAVLIMLLPACGKKKIQIPFYRLDVRVEPSSGKIECNVNIRPAPDSCFYLDGDLQINRIKAGGEEVPFRRESSSKVVMDGLKHDNLQIEYSGFLNNVMSGVNMVNPDLVELALYATWFPILEGGALFEFELNADLPSDFITITNGRLQQKRQYDNRMLTAWVSFKPGFDIVLLASPHLRQVSENQNNTNVEIYYSKLPRDYILAKKDSLISGMAQFTTFYGPPRVKGHLRYVYSPRSGWGYSRIPLFVVSEEYALSLLQEEFGQARDFHGAAHEMAHFWWSIAPTNTPDDWINEGLAEYSGFRLSEACFGREFADLLVREYREHAAASETETAIAETVSSSPDRYVNRYEKTTLLFIEARSRYGSEQLDGVLKTLHTRFAGTQNVTTAIFLDEVEKQLGPDASAFFKKTLYRKKWVEE